MIHEINLRTEPAVAASMMRLTAEASTRLGIDANRIKDLKITRRSIDARQRKVMVQLTLKIYVDEEAPALSYTPVEYHPVESDAKQVVVVGAGPAGLLPPGAGVGVPGCSAGACALVSGTGADDGRFCWPESPGALKEEPGPDVSDGRSTPGPAGPAGPAGAAVVPAIPPGIPSPAPSGAMEATPFGSMVLSPAKASEGSVGANVPDVLRRTTGACPLYVTVWSTSWLTTSPSFVTTRRVSQ